MDNFTNWAEFAVSQGYDAAATSVALSADPGAACPTGSANAWWWNATDYPRPQDDPNHEIVRMTSRAGATLTITRAQEGTSASTKNAAGKTYKIGFGPTAKTFNTDLPADITAAAAAGTAAAAKFPVDLGGANATGTLAAARMPALTGDVTTPGASLATTIANDAVTNAKLANMATQTAKARNTAGTGDPEDVGISAMLDWISSTRGVILYRGAAGWVALAPGTAGNVLQTGGAGADPSWVAAGGGVADGDKGDIVVSGGGSTWTIDTLTITNAKLAANAVTNAKVDAAAAIALSKMESGIAGKFAAFNGSGVLAACNLNKNVGFFSTAATGVTFAGDSLSVNTTGASAPANHWTQLFMSAYAPVAWNTTSGRNTAVSGRTFATVSAQYTAEVHPFRPGVTGQNEILFCWAGINDISSGVSATTLLATAQSYVAAARADGFKVVLFTLTADAELKGSLESQRNHYNNLLRAEAAAGGCDYLVDLAAVCMIPPDPEFADYIHFADTGHVKIAHTVATTLQLGLGATYPIGGVTKALSSRVNGRANNGRGMPTCFRGYADVPIDIMEVDNGSDTGSFGYWGVFSGNLEIGFHSGSGSGDLTADSIISANATDLTLKRNIKVNKTITAAGTTGAQTINKTGGRVNFAASAQTLVVTNSLVDANSVILLTLKFDDATAKSAVVSAQSSGSFTIKLNAAATAETAVGFLVMN